MFEVHDSRYDKEVDEIEFDVALVQERIRDGHVKISDKQEARSKSDPAVLCPQASNKKMEKEGEAVRDWRCGVRVHAGRLVVRTRRTC